MNSSETLRMPVYASLLAALTAVGSYIYIPIGPVPVYLGNLFIYLAGILLGSKWGSACVGIYLLAGALGLPVFSKGGSGIAVFVGPTGGYLFGFMFGVLLMGAITEEGKTRSPFFREKPELNRAVWDVIAMVGGTFNIYLLGVIWLKIITEISFGKALVLGLFPFLPGDAIKIAAAALIARSVRRMVRIEE